MSLHRLPDGRVIEIKDNLGDQELIALQNHLAELYPGYYTPYIEEAERTFGGEIFNAVKQIPGGFINSFLTAGEGVVNYFDQGNDNAVGNLLRNAQEAVSDTYSPLKGYEDAYSTGLGQGLGSFASYFVPGTLASKAAQGTKGFQALSPAEKFARQSAAGIAGVSGLAVPSGIAIAGRTMEQAKAMGEEVSPFQESLAETLGGVIGFTETITPARFLRYVPKSAGKLLPSDRLMFALQSGGIEGAQEAFAGVAQNAVARGIYSDKVPIFESTLDDFTIGGGVGFIADLVTRGLMDKRGIGREYLLDKEREQRKVTEQQRFNKRKDFKKAIDEGAVVLPLESEVDVINTQDAQVDVPVVESTLEFAEIPLLEEFEIIQNPNGTASIIGINTSKDYGVFSNIEEAAKQAVVLRKKLRNDYVDAAVKQNLSVNGLYGNGTAYTLGRKVYDPISNLIPVQVLASLDSRINIARKTKAQKEKEIKQKLDRSIINDLLGDQQLNEEQLIQLEEQLLKQQTSFPIKATKIDASSLVGQLHTRARKKGIAPKSYYTPQEAKKILLPADFNSLMSEKAHVIEKTQRETGDRVAIARSREKIGVTRSDFKKVFKSKNIISDLNSPAFEYIAEQITGTKSFNNMNRGQKELLINELKRLPRFDVETKLPDFRPRAYSVNDLNRLYTEYKGQRITNNEIKAFVKNKQTGKNLTPKELKALREDLVNSGRADKVNNRLEMSDDFEKRQAKRAQSLNESTEEFAQRLRETTALSEQEINNVLEKDIKDVVETDELLALPAPESVGKYKKLFEFARKRLNQLGLKDIALKFDNALKMSTEIRFVDGKPVFNPVPFENKASFDIPMRTILAAMNRIDPDGTLTEAEFQSKLAGLMDHEAIHALRELDLLTEDEYQTLVEYAIEKLPEDLKRGITRAYPDNLVIRDEEYVAELFRLYRENPKQIIGKPKSIIKRIIDFFFGAVDSIFGAGFRSPESILQDLDTGVIGSRARNKVRSLRETQLKQAAGLTNPESRFSKEIDTVRNLLATAESELYTAESILNVDGPYVGKKRFQKLFSDMLRAQNKVDNLREELKDLTGGVKSFEKRNAVEVGEQLSNKEKEELLDGEFYYHATSTKAANSIREKGIRLTDDDGNLLPSNFIRAETGQRYQESPKIFAFKNPADAVAFYRGVYSNSELDELSLVKFRKSDYNFEPDPGNTGEPMFSQTAKNLNINLDDGEYKASVQTTLGTSAIEPEDIVGVRTFKELENSFADPTHFRGYGRHRETMLDVGGNPYGFAKIISDSFESKSSPEIVSRFSKSGLTAQNTLYPGETERSLLTLYRSNKGNLTANNLQALHKSVSPQSKRKHKWRDIKEIRNDLRDAITKNMDYLWYERWGVGIPNIVGDVNMNEFSAIFGITSAQSKPEQNLKDTLRAMIVARKIDPVEQPKKYIAELKKFGVAMNNNARLNDIAKVYKTGLYNRQGTGQKTATYALEILDAANNRFTPFSVIDRHMLRKFGIELQEGQKTTEQEYRITQGLISLLAAENITVNGEPRNFTPRQVQALLWAHQRYSGPTNVTNEGSYNSAVSAAQEEISDLKNLESEGLFSKDRTFSGVFIHQPRFNSKAKSNLFDTDLKNNMYQMIVNEAPTVLFEFKMGKTRGYLPENIDQSINFDQFFDYQENMLNAITSGNKIRFLRELGIPHEITRSAGTYDGYLNPNILLKLPGAEPRLVRALAQIFTDAFMQDSAITLRPTKQGVFQTGLIIEKSDQSLFTVAELQDLNRSLSEMTRGGEQVNFTLQATDKTGIVLIDPISFNKDRPYTKQDANNFAESIRPILGGKGYNLKRYGQESEYIEYGAESSYSPGTRSAIRGLRDRESLLESSDLQRAALRDLYIPAYEAYKKFAKEIGLTQEQAPNLNLKPYEQENSALAGETVLADIDIAEVQREARRRAERYSRGNIPRFNTNASPVALAIAFEYEANPKKFDVPPDISSRFYRDYAKIPKGYEGVLDDIGGAEQPSESFGQSILKSLGWRGSIGNWLSDARTQFIDKLNDVEKGIIQSAEKSAEVRELENLADTSAIAALRHADRARGIFAAMLKNGVPTLEKGLTSVKDFEYGGLLEIFAPLFADPEVNLEQLFKIYAIAQRSERLAMEGKKVPVTEETKIKAKQIEQDFPIVKEVWNKYQAYNNEVIKFAVDSGILSYDRSKNELIKDIVENTDNKAKDLVNLELNDLLKIAAAEGIETRGTAQIWLDNSDYYPFYRQMQDETIKGPNIAAGYISGNPLNIKLKGSKEDINISPLEAIARNNLAIVTAAMKNEGLARLARNFELAGMADRVPAKKAKGADIMPVFIDGERVFFKVDDPLLINGLQAMGINDQGILGQVLGAPAGFLRETITRDPGFMFVNLLRDSLSTAVTSGADITPIVDTFDKFFNSNLTELERFGIVGGYDFSNDPQNIKQYIKKEYRKMGIGNNGALTATDAVIKLWDWLGEYTTKSDGATRSAVYDKIFELTGSQAEAAYQALEIINFGRRGASPIFRLVTTAVTFLNARLQGLDVLGRAHLGRYSAVSKFGKDQTLEDMRNGIALGTFQRGMFLALLTGLYYVMFSDEEEYKNARREVRDDNWIIPLFEGMPALKIPIPFEVGVLYKVVPERALDLAIGDADLDETMKTLGRQLGVTLKVDLTPQVVKPLIEVINNRNNYTGQDIVPYYMEQGMEAGYQSRYSTNEFVRLLGETLNISPLKLEYFLRGYTGTIGTYVLSTVDAVTRQFTDRDVIMPRIDSAPLLRRFFQTELGGGYQQQFYELRAESDKFIQTLNSLKREGRLEEAQAFLLNNQGLARTRPQILALERYMNNYRKQRDRVLNSDLSPENKKAILEQLDYERDIRLMYLNTLKEQI